MRHASRLLALAALAAASVVSRPAYAATTLPQEPPAGQFQPGVRILVDDGSCPAGQIKEVVDVATAPPPGTRVAGVRRIRHCIRR